MSKTKKEVSSDENVVVGFHRIVSPATPCTDWIVLIFAEADGNDNLFLISDQEKNTTDTDFFSAVNSIKESFSGIQMTRMKQARI